MDKEKVVDAVLNLMDTLIETIAEEANKKIKEKNSPKILSQADVRRIYCIGMGKLNQLVSDGLTEFREGGRVYYPTNELDTLESIGKIKKRISNGKQEKKI